MSNANNAIKSGKTVTDDLGKLKSKLWMALRKFQQADTSLRREFNMRTDVKVKTKASAKRDKVSEVKEELIGIKAKYNITDDDMFDLFNVPALDDAAKSEKEIRYSHHPEQYGDCALLKEWKYLKNEYGYKRLIKKGDFWYAIK